MMKTRHTHIEAIGKDCIGHIFALMALKELGSVIVRISKQWKHIVELCMAKRDEVLEPNVDAESLNAIFTALGQLQSPIGRRHIGKAHFGPRIPWRFLPEVIRSIFAKTLASSLAVPSSLHTLRLNNAALSSEDFDKIFTALHHHSALTHLNVSNNRLGRHYGHHDHDEDGEDDDDDNDDNITKSLAELIRHNRAITTLIIHDCHISSRRMVNILSALQPTTTLETLMLDGNTLHSASIHILAQVLSTNTSLTDLFVKYGSLQVDDMKAFCRPIANSRSLKSLRLGLNRFDDACAQPLSEMIRCNSALTYLDIGHRIRAKGMPIILNAVSSNSTIEKLGIGCNHLDSECASALADMLARNCTLTELELSEMWEEMDWKSFFVGLRQNRSITKINLCHNEFTIDDIRPLVSLVTDSDHPSPIRSIDLSYSSHCDESISLIADMLKHSNCRLTSLMMPSYEMTPTGFETLLLALHHNTSLTQVNLSCRHFKFSDHLVSRLLTLAQSNTTIKTFNFERSSLTSEMINSISVTECKNDNLKKSYQARLTRWS